MSRGAGCQWALLQQIVIPCGKGLANLVILKTRKKHMFIETVLDFGLSSYQVFGMCSPNNGSAVQSTEEAISSAHGHALTRGCQYCGLARMCMRITVKLTSFFSIAPSMTSSTLIEIALRISVENFSVDWSSVSKTAISATVE
jgi:hypothetical protein